MTIIKNKSQFVKKSSLHTPYAHPDVQLLFNNIENSTLTLVLCYWTMIFGILSETLESVVRVFVSWGIFFVW